MFLIPTHTLDNPVSDAVSGAATATVDQVGGVANILNEFGPVVTILAVFVVLFITILLVFMRNNKKLMDKVLESGSSNEETVQELIAKVIDIYSEKNKDITKTSVEEVLNKEKASHKNIVDVYINANLAFKDASKIVMGKLKCTRVAIYLFHNGNSTPYGYPFAKMSCVHEYTNKGTCNTIRGQNHIDIPLYVFSSIIEGLSMNGEYYINDIFRMINDDDQSELIKFIQGDSIQSIFALAIKDNDDRVAAFTIVEYDDVQQFGFNAATDEVRAALSTMNNSIHSIVISDTFKSKYGDS